MGLVVVIVAAISAVNGLRRCPWHCADHTFREVPFVYLSSVLVHRLLPHYSHLIHGHLVCKSHGMCVPHCKRVNNREREKKGRKRERKKERKNDYYYRQIIPGDECGLNFLIFVLQLGKTPGIKFKQGNGLDRGSKLIHWVRGNDVTSPLKWWSGRDREFSYLKSKTS